MDGDGDDGDGTAGRGQGGAAGDSGGAGDARGEPLLLDAMLGKLATYLRMCGYDTAYALDRGVEADDRLREVAETEGRTLLTRDADLAAAVEDALFVESTAVEDQLRELRRAGYDLTLPDRPARCGRCNGRVHPVDPGDDRPAYAPDEGRVWRCEACGQCFWKGSHWDDVRERLASL